MHCKNYLFRLSCAIILIMLFLGFNTVLAAQPTKPGSDHFNKGCEYHSQKKFELAIDEYSKAIQVNATYVTAYDNRGLGYHAIGKNDLAVADYTKAIELTPTNFFIYIHRGDAYCDLNLFDQAFQDYNKALEINPFSFVAYYCKGTAYEKIGNMQEAVKCYKEFMRWVPNEPPYIEAINYVRQTIDRFYTEKTKQMEKANNAQNSEQLLKEASEQLSTGDTTGALASYTLAIKLNSTNDAALLKEASEQLSVGDTNGASATYDLARKANSATAAAYNGRAAVYFSLGRYDESIADSDRASELMPKYAAAWNTKGKAYLAKKDYNNALAAFQKAVQLAPDVQQFSDDLAATRQQQLEDIKQTYPVGSKVEVVRWPNLYVPVRYGYAGIVKGYSDQEVELEVCAFIRVWENIEKDPATGNQYLYKKSGIGTTVFMSPLYITGVYDGPIQSNSSEYTASTNTDSGSSGYQTTSQNNARVFVYRNNTDSSAFTFHIKIREIAEDNNFVTAVLYDKNGNILQDLSRNTTMYRNIFTDSFVTPYTDYLPIRVVVSFVNDHHEHAQTSVLFTEAGGYSLDIND